MVLTTAVVSMAATLAGCGASASRSTAYSALDTAVLATPTPTKITAWRASRRVPEVTATVVTGEAWPVHLTRQSKQPARRL